MNVQIEESWKQVLTPEFDKDYFIRLTEFVRREYQTTTVYPPGKLIFNAFNLCPYNKVKVVIIGRGPIPRSRTSTWPLFLCKRRYSFSSVAAKYFQGNT